jgi:hypothetical protein
VAPAQLHKRNTREILFRRTAIYTSKRKPERWSSETRNFMSFQAFWFHEVGM